MLHRLLSYRIFRFAIGGGVATAFNLLLMFILIDVCGLDTFVLRNVANAASIELSLLFSFFIYRTWVWPGRDQKAYEVLWRQIPLYHLSAGMAASARILVFFPALDLLGINYAVNALIGIALGAGVNYMISDRVVFKTRTQHSSEPKLKSLPEHYHRHKLVPAFTQEDQPKSS